ncbi:MAG: sn-glycerol-1-phosphate dehydrogenase [Sphaerochaetaceae bacterium]
MKTFLEEALKKATDTKIFLSEVGAIKKLPQLLLEHLPGKTFTLIADENTWKAAGEMVGHTLTEAKIPLTSPVIENFEGTYKSAEQISRIIKERATVPIAVGSGTINDLVKLAAQQNSQPYIVVATAPSVDGYASAGAALLTDGVKMTHPCNAPAIIIGESAVLSSAPKELKSAGYADLLAKVPAGGDWLVADYLGEDPLNRESWALVQHHLKEFLTIPVDWDNLFKGLTLAGLAMQYQRDSRPVSGGEHLLSHIWEMEGKTPYLHGHKVGIGTLITTALYTYLLEEGVEGGEPLKPREEVLKAKLTLLEDSFSYLGDLSKMERILQEKYSVTKSQAQRRESLIEGWPLLQEKLRAQLFSYEESEERLKAVGAPTTAREIGLVRETAIEDVRKAQLLRNRYTILDVIDDLGVLEKALEYLKDGPFLKS